MGAMAWWRYTGRVMTRAGYTDWIWVPLLRRCWVGPYKVEVTPIVAGKGFLFDGLLQVVTIRDVLLGRALYEELFPYSTVAAIYPSVVKRPIGNWFERASGDRRETTTYNVELEIQTRDGQFSQIIRIPLGPWEKRAHRVVDAILSVYPEITTEARRRGGFRP